MMLDAGFPGLPQLLEIRFMAELSDQAIDTLFISQFAAAPRR